MISCGSVVPLLPDKPDWVIMVEMIPCTILNTASIKSSPYVTAAFAKAKRMNNFKACSGRFTSVKEPQVLTTPTAKNSTSKPYPMAFSAPLISSITCQIPPPLKFSGLVVNSVQISDSLLFHVSSEELRLSMIQFPLEMVSPPVVSGRAVSLSPYSYQPVISVRISLVNVMTMPPATVRMPFARCDGSCDLRDKPTCKMPKPSRIKPTARMSEKMKSLRLLTTASGSPSAANAGTTKTASMKNTLAKME